jgi:hypothetical protein
MTFYQPDSEFIDDSLLEAPKPGERILGIDEVIEHVAPIYNAGNLGPDSTQDERHAVFTAALRKVIADGAILMPRAHPADGRLCLVSLYDPLVCCRPVLAGSAEDLSHLRWS